MEINLYQLQNCAEQASAGERLCRQLLEQLSQELHASELDCAAEWEEYLSLKKDIDAYGAVLRQYARLLSVLDNAAGLYVQALENADAIAAEAQLLQQVKVRSVSLQYLRDFLSDVPFEKGEPTDD